MTTDLASHPTVALVDRLLGAICAADLDGARACYAPDVRIWHNFDEVSQTVEENLRVLSWMSKRLHDRTYAVTRRELLADGLLQQHVLTGTVVATGAAFRMPAVIIFTVADGLITKLEEYLDTAQAAALGG